MEQFIDRYKRVFRSVLFLFVNVLLISLVSCAPSDRVAKVKPLRTQNIVIVVIDGPRYSETWDNTPGLIPFMSGKLRSKGTFFSNFLNDGPTYTNPGHVAITTGVNQVLDNYGDELPANPSIFQYWLKKTGKPPTSAWVVASKDKLQILADTKDSLWHSSFNPETNCGVAGPGTGYRADSLTLKVAKDILATHKPNIMLINFMEPDGFAHAGNWEYYLRGIARSDRYIKELWDYLRKDKHYKKKTALLITNDHGRHLDGVQNGFIDHGDNCAGCQKISLLAVGPDFKKRHVIDQLHRLEDIPVTIAPILGVHLEKAQGQVVMDLYTTKALKSLEAIPIPEQK